MVVMQSMVIVDQKLASVVIGMAGDFHAYRTSGGFEVPAWAALLASAQVDAWVRGGQNDSAWVSVWQLAKNHTWTDQADFIATRKGLTHLTVWLRAWCAKYGIVIPHGIVIPAMQPLVEAA
jgi:hypothetical protein